MPQLFQEPKGYFKLESSCKVTAVRIDAGKKKTLYAFRIVWPADGADGELEGRTPSHASTDAKNKTKVTARKSKDRDRGGGASSGDEKAGSSGAASSGKMGVTVGGAMVGAMTTGVGVLGGMLLAGAATAGGERPASGDRREKHLTLGCDKLIDAERWVAAVQGEIVKIGGCKELVSSDYWSGDAGPPLEVRLEEVEGWIRSTRWRVHRLMHGIRVFEQTVAGTDSASDSFEFGTAPSPGAGSLAAAPCLRINLGMNASPAHVFGTIMSMPPACRTGTVQSFGLVETLTQFVDIVHLTLDPVYLFPSWTAPRDLCLIRYWKQNPDGGYVVCLDSTAHADCPLLPGHVRGELHAAYVIAAPKFIAGIDGEVDDATECMLSCIIQVYIYTYTYIIYYIAYSI
jgi:hypothetical protein